MGDSGNGKVQKSPKGINIGKSAFWEIAEMVKYKNRPKGINEGKSAFRQIAKMVKYQKLP